MQIFVMLAVLLSLPVYAEEPIRVQTTPVVQAVNLSPIETSSEQNVIRLQPQQEVPIKVQATPKIPQTIQEIKPQTQVQSIPQTPMQTLQPIQIEPTKQQNNNTLTTPTNISAEYCSKMFQTSTETLFILTLGAIEANNLQIQEIQSKGGYITFKAKDKEFLATIAEVDAKNSILKINPTNGVYHFAPGIVTKIFEYIAYKLK